MTVLHSLKTRAFETIRCTRHNWLHLKMFRIDYDGHEWHVRDTHGLHLRFTSYPYLPFIETEGYLRQGQWQLQPGMTVLDVGACFGEFALYAAHRVGPTGRVLMLEPDPENLKKADELFDYNGGKPQQLTVVPAGLWKEPGTLSFAAGLGQCSVLVDPANTASAPGNVISIAVHSMQSLVDAYDLSKVDLVKMDIEGPETDVMETADDFVGQYSPRFSIASYHPWKTGQTCDMLEPKFKQLGYAVRTGFPVHKTTWAWREPA